MIISRFLSERAGDALPRELVALALLVSGLSAWLAWYIDGADFRGYDASVNVLASLIVLGPGLLVTNIFFVRNWRLRRDDEELVRAVDRYIFLNLIFFLLRLNLLEAMASLRTIVPDGSLPLRKHVMAETTTGRPASWHEALEMLASDWAQVSLVLQIIEDSDSRLLMARWNPLCYLQTPNSLKHLSRSLGRHMPADLIDIRVDQVAKSAADVRNDLENIRADTQPDEGSLRRYHSGVNIIVDGLRGIVSELQRELPQVPYDWDVSSAGGDWDSQQGEALRKKMTLKKSFESSDPSLTEMI